MSHAELNYLTKKIQEIEKYETHKQISLIDYELNLTAQPTNPDGKIDQIARDDCFENAKRIRANLLGEEYRDKRSAISQFTENYRKKGYKITQLSVKDWKKYIKNK
jgi:hypothetical protein